MPAVLVAIRKRLYRLTTKVFASDVVLSIYRGVLKREPDPPGLKNYTTLIRSLHDLEYVVGDIISSAEFRKTILSRQAPERVREIWRQLLNREPEEWEDTFYSERIVEASGISTVLSDVTSSQEYRNKTLSALAPGFVRAAYLAMLNREPDSEGLKNYVNLVLDRKDAGVILERIINSDEFFSRFSCELSFRLVRVLHTILLGREPDKQFLEDYRDVFTEKRLVELIDRIVHSEEYRKIWHTKVIPNLVQSIYRGILGRDPNTDSEKLFVESITEAESVYGVVVGLIQSREFKDRFYSLLVPELIRAAYQGVLKREPDSGGLKAYSTLLMESRALDHILSELIASSEFTRKYWLKNARELKHPDESYDTPTIVFLHVQKTAGTSVRRMLLRRYHKGIVYSEHADTLHLRSPAELSKYSVFAGHFNYDSLRFIPRRSVSIVTFIREPKERLISLYYFWRAHEPSHPNFHGGMVYASTMMIREFVERNWEEHPAVWNHMTWALMGQRKWAEWRDRLRQTKTDAEVSTFIESDVRSAVRTRLGEFLFVGLQEDFKRSAETLFLFLNKTPTKPTHDHSLEQLMRDEVGFKREIDKQPLTPVIDLAIDRLVQLDRVIYEEAKSLYQARVASENQHGAEELAI